MSSSTLSSLAAMGLLVTFWLLAITEEQGTQFLAAFGAGVTALVTIKLILAAVRADERERLAADIRRSEQAS